MFTNIILNLKIGFKWVKLMLEKIEIIQRFNFKNLNKHYECFIIDLVRGKAYFNINEMIYPDRFFETNYLSSYSWSPILNDLKKEFQVKSIIWMITQLIISKRNFLN